MQTETIVISVGGSLIVPGEVNVPFLQALNAFIRKGIENGRRFVIITGGGKTARHYQEAARAVGDLLPEDLDWLGIHATRLNGHLLRAVFHDVAYPVLIKDPSNEITTDKPVIIAAGWKPGWSTDYVAVQIAKRIGAKKLVNLSNIDYVYNKDPRTSPHAEPIAEIEWPAFRALLPETWDPGLSSPFDPIAARDAEAESMEVAIINGTKLEEMEKYLNGEACIGTRIR